MFGRLGMHFVFCSIRFSFLLFTKVPLCLSVIWIEDTNLIAYIFGFAAISVRYLITLQ